MDSRDSSVAGKAASLLESVSTPGFRLSLEILCLVLNITKPLLVRLQSPNQDFLQALDSVPDAVRVLQSLRDDTDKFHELYTAVEEAVGGGAHASLGQSDESGRQMCAPILQGQHVQGPAVAMVHTKVRSFFCLPNVFLRILE